MWGARSSRGMGLAPPNHRTHNRHQPKRQQLPDTISPNRSSVLTIDIKSTTPNSLNPPLRSTITLISLKPPTPPIPPTPQTCSPHPTTGVTNPKKIFQGQTNITLPSPHNTTPTPPSHPTNTTPKPDNPPPSHTPRPAKSTPTHPPHTPPPTRPSCAMVLHPSCLTNAHISTQRLSHPTLSIPPHTTPQPTHSKIHNLPNSEDDPLTPPRPHHPPHLQYTIPPTHISITRHSTSIPLQAHNIPTPITPPKALSSIHSHLPHLPKPDLPPHLSPHPPHKITLPKPLTLPPSPHSLQTSITQTIVPHPPLPQPLHPNPPLPPHPSTSKPSFARPLRPCRIVRITDFPTSTIILYPDLLDRATRSAKPTRTITSGRVEV